MQCRAVGRPRRPKVEHHCITAGEVASRIPLETAKVSPARAQRMANVIQVLQTPSLLILVDNACARAALSSELGEQRGRLSALYQSGFDSLVGLSVKSFIVVTPAVLLMSKSWWLLKEKSTLRPPRSPYQADPLGCDRYHH